MSQADRRAFLKFLASSPLLAAAAWAQQPPASPASDILTVMDFEEAARRVLSPAHWVDF